MIYFIPMFTPYEIVSLFNLKFVLGRIEPKHEEITKSTWTLRGAVTLSITTHSITTFSITTFSITTLSITTLSITTFSIAIINRDTQPNGTSCRMLLC